MCPVPGVSENLPILAGAASSLPPSLLPLSCLDRPKWTLLADPRPIVDRAGSLPIRSHSPDDKSASYREVQDGEED
eukprot:751775-Hanusia_phi.AAC.2